MWAVLVILFAAGPTLYVHLVAFAAASRLANGGETLAIARLQRSCRGRVLKAYGLVFGFRDAPATLLQRCMRSGRGKLLTFVKFGQIVFEVGTIVGVVGPGGRAAELLLNAHIGALFQLFTVDCAMVINQHVVLVAVTVWPLLCAQLLFVAVCIRARMRPASYEAVRDASIRAFTELIVFIYPGFSATILSSFVYDSIYHYQGDEAPLRVLRRDPTIDYDADTSRIMRIYAAVMICVYPIGVPLLLAAGMYLQVQASAAKTKLSGVRGVLATSALCVQRNLRKGFGWYACVELARRILLTSGFLLILLWSFRAASNYFIACNIAFLVITTYVQPFARVDDEWFEIASQSLLVVLALGINAFEGIESAPTSTDPVVVWVCSLELICFCVLTVWGGLVFAAHDANAVGDKDLQDAEDASFMEHEGSKTAMSGVSRIFTVETGPGDEIPTAVLPPNSPIARREVSLVEIDEDPESLDKAKPAAS